MKNNANIAKELDFVLSQAQLNSDVESLVSDTLDAVKVAQEDLKLNGF